VIHFPRNPRRCFPSFSLFLRLFTALSSSLSLSLSLILPPARCHLFSRFASPCVRACLPFFINASRPLSAAFPLFAHDTTLIIVTLQILTCKYSFAKASKITERLDAHLRDAISHPLRGARRRMSLAIVKKNSKRASFCSFPSKEFGQSLRSRGR
jgi:hypothetical protein